MKILNEKEGLFWCLNDIENYRDKTEYVEKCYTYAYYVVH